MAATLFLLGYPGVSGLSPIPSRGEGFLVRWARWDRNALAPDFGGTLLGLASRAAPSYEKHATNNREVLGSAGSVDRF
eukprot:5403157-Alexandrium_andersonii.AAC.1